MTIVLLVFVAPCVGYMTLMHGYDGSVITIGHY